MKVLHIAEYIKGGVATILNELVDSQSQSMDISILINEEHLDYINGNNVATYKGTRSVTGMFSFAKAILKSYLKVKPDIVHLHSSFAGFVGRIVLLPFPVKIIYQPHGVSFDRDRISGWKRSILALIEKILAIKCTKIIAISEYEYNELAAVISDNKIALATNGVVDTQIPLNYQRNDKILFVGRFDKQKGLDLLLEYYQNNNAQYALDIVGSSVINNQENNQALDQVSYLGWKTPEELEQLFSSYSAVIMPSRWEGFGLVAIEALRSGTPVICSNRGALPYIIKDGDNGFIIELDNFNTSLNRALSELKQVNLAALIDQSRASYLQKYTSENMCQAVSLIYTQ